MTDLPKILAVVGTTCSGKTDLGLVLARAVDGEVICADSRTIYKGLDIGTAKPVGRRDWGFGTLGDDKPLVVDGIFHWGLDLVEPDVAFSAADFQTYADKKIAQILERGRTPILVGGTGLYIRAVIDRPTFGAVAPDQELRLLLATLSNEDLLQEIAVRDPDTAATIDLHNRRRLERAVEMLRATGLPLAETRTFATPLYRATQVGLTVSRDALYTRIAQRVQRMIADGLVDEVRNIFQKYGADCPALSGIGYRELVHFFQGKMSLAAAIAEIVRNTQLYAKRQETWFKRDTRIHWFTNNDDVLASRIFLN